MGSRTEIGIGLGTVGGVFSGGSSLSVVPRGASFERSAVVTEKGLNIVKSHLAQFGDDAGNAGMIQRLENSIANGRRVTGPDRNFYMHELKEATLMRRGMPYNSAHPEAIRWDRVSPFELYHPEVIKANPTIFNPNFLEFWRIPPPK